MKSSGLARRAFLKRFGGGAASASVVSSLAACRIRHEDSIAAAVVPEPGVAKPFADLRSAYSLAPDLLYFNNASIGCMPNAVLDARNDYTRICESNPWLYMWGGEWDEPKELSRTKAAEFLGCDPMELALVHNTTEAFNILAHGVELGPKDEVLISSITHKGAKTAWEKQAPHRGFQVRSFDFPIDRATDISVDELVELHAKEVRDETKVMILTDIDNIVGMRIPLAKVAAAVRKQGVDIVAVDGAQGAGQLPLTLSDLDIDVYATSTHKWMQTPKGMGLMYVRKGAQEKIRPMITTWGQRKWGEDARRYEDYGTRNLPDVMTLAHALDFQTQLNRELVMSRRAELRAYMKTRVDDDPQLRWLSPADGPLASGIYAIAAKGEFAGKTVARRLFEEHQVVVRGFERDDVQCIRVSPNVIDNEVAIDQFLTKLRATIA